MRWGGHDGDPSTVSSRPVLASCIRGHAFVDLTAAGHVKHPHTIAECRSQPFVFRNRTKPLGRSEVQWGQASTVWVCHCLQVVAECRECQTEQKCSCWEVTRVLSALLLGPRFSGRQVVGHNLICSMARRFCRMPLPWMLFPSIGALRGEHSSVEGHWCSWSHLQRHHGGWSHRVQSRRRRCACRKQSVHVRPCIGSLQIWGRQSCRRLKNLMPPASFLCDSAPSSSSPPYNILSKICPHFRLSSPPPRHGSTLPGKGQCCVWTHFSSFHLEAHHFPCVHQNKCTGCRNWILDSATGVFHQPASSSQFLGTQRHTQGRHPSLSRVEVGLSLTLLHQWEKEGSWPGLAMQLSVLNGPCHATAGAASFPVPSTKRPFFAGASAPRRPKIAPETT